MDKHRKKGASSDQCYVRDTESHQYHTPSLSPLGVATQKAHCIKHRNAFGNQSDEGAEENACNYRYRIAMNIKVMARFFRNLPASKDGPHWQWRQEQGFARETSHRTIVRARLGARQVLSHLSHAQKNGPQKAGGPSELKCHACNWAGLSRSAGEPIILRPGPSTGTSLPI